MGEGAEVSVCVVRLMGESFWSVRACVARGGQGKERRRVEVEGSNLATQG